MWLETRQCQRSWISVPQEEKYFMNAEGDLLLAAISKIKMGNLYQQRLNSPACQNNATVFVVYQHRPLIFHC